MRLVYVHLNDVYSQENNSKNSPDIRSNQKLKLINYIINRLVLLLLLTTVFRTNNAKVN